MKDDEWFKEGSASVNILDKDKKGDHYGKLRNA